MNTEARNVAIEIVSMLDQFGRDGRGSFILDLNACLIFKDMVESIVESHIRGEAI